MSGTFNLIKEFMSALNASEQNKTQPYDTQGTVKRVEGDTAWVQLTGSDRETPIQMTIACDVGDTVQARIGGGSAWLTGNLTAPPTDDKKAVEAITMVNNVVQEVKEEVSEALEDVSTVDDVTMQYCLSDSSSTFVQYGDWSNTPPTYVSGKYYWTRSVLVDDDGNETYGEPRYSQDTQLSVETDVAFKSNNNHFWHDNSGAYVTTTNKSYSTGSAVRITASGILQQVNGNTVSSWTNSGISFYQGIDSYGYPITAASFGSGGVSLYENGNNVAYLASTLRLGRSDAANIQIPSVTETQTGYHSDINFYYNGTKNGNITSGRNGSTYYTSMMANGGYLTINDSSGSIGVTTNGRLSCSSYISVGGYKILSTGTVTATGSVAANATGSGTATASKSGYTPIGILGFNPSGSNYGHLNIYDVSLSGSTVTWRGYNFGSNTAEVNMTITVLYIASSQGV